MSVTAPTEDKEPKPAELRTRIPLCIFSTHTVHGRLSVLLHFIETVAALLGSSLRRRNFKLEYKPRNQ